MASYLHGKQLTFRKSFSHLHCKPLMHHLHVAKEITAAVELLLAHRAQPVAGGPIPLLSQQDEALDKLVHHIVTLFTTNPCSQFAIQYIAYTGNGNMRGIRCPYLKSMLIAGTAASKGHVHT